MEPTESQPIENGNSTEEVTKRSIRVQTWKKIQKQKCAIPLSDVYNKIPNFKGSAETAELFAQLDEFKNAKHIKVNLDRAQEPVKLEVIKAGKNLYVPPFKETGSTALFTKVECPTDADLNTQKTYVRLRGPDESRKDIGIDTDIKLDILVVGSCAVSRKGQRIGKGNGYVDLDFGLLAQLGVLTEKTLVVTTVHEIQVYDELPEDLFQSFDLPVDVIITPKEIIRVPKRLPRPSGIEWSILSTRRVNLIPAIAALKEKLEKDGKIIVLKEEDTDIETTRKNRNNRQRNRYNRKKRHNSGKKDDNNLNESEDSQPSRRRKARGENSSRSEKNQEESGGAKENAKESGNKKSKKLQKNRQKRDNRDLCIKVSNIAKDVRIKDLKTELREKGCNPTFISWKGNFGKCYLHFAKKRDEDEAKAAADILELLAGLSLDVKCEVVIRDNNANPDAEDADGDGEADADADAEVGNSEPTQRIETTDVTAV